MRKILTLILCILLAKDFYGQDPNFSQFFVSPLTLNPALTGKFNGGYRIAGNYRNQWPTISNAFKTGTASIDLPILTNRISEIDRWGVGVLALTDKSGNGILNNNYLSLSTAYHKGLDEDGYHQLGVGFQGTYAQSRLDGTKLNLGDELDANGTWTSPTQDPLNNVVFNKNYFDLAAGIFYNGATSDWNNFYFGISMYHINKPKESFTDALFYLNPRVTVQAGGYFPLSETANLHLSAMHSNQASARNTVAGGAVEFLLNQDEYAPVSMYAGAWLRLKDAVIPYVGLEINNEWRFGLSYDVNTSSLKPASNTRGGIELSLIYTRQPRDPNARKLNCPKF
ncbi:PorP/SprF family type IX secretion system membrane protein [Parasegetibacter sp. NRK P23]|uniref:PorP/SprF family type IX secretion system membrane protein n=1 Tax=Parasegetibacter sp. NRK P23 TaxID=2942999 RepID=UPI0020434B50|nr:PorP/SprF family type IX secretion system membrane protein [Parasegetibacter sp. NRK P23]MCM5527474.1 PorP/SprF family type IX secretion system membrane protein [Parasegetibacter sp. NRK P23]